MLTRYSHPDMRAIWTDQHKFETWLNVELLATEAWSKLGLVPQEDLEKLKKNAKFNIPRILELEAETKHDVVAFTRCVSESLGDEKKWLHYGLTSTDVCDTAYGVLYKEANSILREDLHRLIELLGNKAIEYKFTPMMGRTHGIHAEITSFGLTLGLWYAEMQRNLKRFEAASIEIEAGKISGAVGTFANTPPFVQDYVCANLGIQSSSISTQVLQRDRHAAYFSVLALIGSSIEKMATEIRHLQRTELREVEEFFSEGQKGSSAMPHKRNPISSENLCGCARVLRGYMDTAYENISLWHQRDISHSSAERIIAPDATALLDYMLKRFYNILNDLTVFEDRMLENISMSYGVVFSQHILLALIEKGVSREEAYDNVQPLAMHCWKTRSQFCDAVDNSEFIKSHLSDEEINQCFDPQYHLKLVNEIFGRIGLA